MKTYDNPQLFQKEMSRLRLGRKTLGFVPTMGALHEGHLSLIRKARRQNDIVVVSIFVNPLQFGPKEDLTRYPRPLARDRKLLLKEKVDYLFAPRRSLFYPKDFQTSVEVGKLSRTLCGPFRPGHFRGVATVVTKLFNLVRPDLAYFGAKDFQQAMLIKRLAQDLDFNIEIKVLPLIRDKDGLALSSRNAFLSAKQRQSALTLPETLQWAQGEVRRGRPLARIRQEAYRRLRHGLDRVDYVEFVQPETFQVVKSSRGGVLLAVAGWVGKTRLIDNVIIRP